MRIFLALTVVLFATSCVNQKRCSRKFPPQTVTIYHDSIRQTIVYRDTTIFIEFPADTVYNSDTILIEKKQVLNTRITAESKMATAMAWISQNKLNLMLADKDTTIEVRLIKALKEAVYWQSKYHSDKQTVNVPFVPKFWKVTGWIGIISIILILLFIGYKLM